jgi:polyribonucleotide nucleotidyltransferase
MAAAITQHSGALSAHAPQIVRLQIDKDKIRELIGPGGKMIKEICEVSGAKIDISDDGVVQVSAVGQDKIDIALARIKLITFEPEVGSIVDGKIVKILESGAFVSIPGGKDGYLHISEISKERIASIEDHLSVGQAVKVKIIGFEKGKIKVSMKAALTDGSDEPQAEKKTEKSGDRAESKKSEEPRRSERSEKPEEPRKSEERAKPEEPRRNDKKPERRRENRGQENFPPATSGPIVKERKYFN